VEGERLDERVREEKGDVKVVEKGEGIGEECTVVRGGNKKVGKMGRGRGGC
jgi:hypothetical protein